MSGPLLQSWNAGRLAFRRVLHRAYVRASGCDPRSGTLFVVGSGSLSIDAAGRRHELVAASAMFVPPGTETVAMGHEDAECICVSVEGAMLRGVFSERTARAWSLNLLRECSTRGPGWELMAEGWALVGVGHLARLSELAGSRPEWLDEVLAGARDYRSLSEIAQAIGRHPSHVAREFRRHEGVSVGEYARRCRLELAARELRAGNAALSSVAIRAGFCDQSHFTNAFRRLFGVTPAEYRRGAKPDRLRG